MAECGQNLRQYREYASDEIIEHLVSLRRIDDQIQDTFFSEEAVDLPVTDSRNLMNLRFMETQLDDWRRGNYSDEFQRGMMFHLTIHITPADLVLALVVT